MRQQQELKDIRKQTVEQQEAALGLKLRRQQQLEARLAAAHRRKRERLGLPPDEPAVPGIDLYIKCLYPTFNIQL